MANLDYLYNKDNVPLVFGKNHFLNRKLHFKIIERATVLPHRSMNINGNLNSSFGGIVDQTGKFLKSSSVYHSMGAAYTPTEEIQHVPKTVVYLGLLCPVWGHFITDNLKLLWFLKCSDFERHFKNCPLVYLPWSDGGGIA